MHLPLTFACNSGDGTELGIRNIDDDHRGTPIISLSTGEDTITIFLNRHDAQLLIEALQSIITHDA